MHGTLHLKLDFKLRSVIACPLQQRNGFAGQRRVYGLLVPTQNLEPLCSPARTMNACIKTMCRVTFAGLPLLGTLLSLAPLGFLRNCALASLLRS